MNKILKSFQMPITVTVSEEDIDDIMVTALEGGITHWCDEAKVVEEKRCGEYGHEQIARGGELLLHLIEPFDEANTEWYSLTLDNLMEGLKRFLLYNNAYISPDTDDDCCIVDTAMCDIVAADSIIQFALFGEEVFG